MALRAAVEVQRIVTVEIAEALELVLDHVRMHDVHDDGDALGMRGVDECLELLRSAEARAQREDVGDLIAEGAIVRMLLKGHDLEDIVAQVRDLGQHIPAEILKSGDSFLLPAHANVALVDEGIGTLAGTAVLPDIRLGRIPDLGAERLGIGILDGAGDISRQALAATAYPLDVELVQVAVVEEHPGKGDLPVAAAGRLEGVPFCTVPVVEVSDEINPGGVGGPLAEHPASVLRTVQAVEQVVVHPG